MIRKYISGINFLLIGAWALIASCGPLYIPDPIDPRLPKYTEDGNNVAGALINDSLWTSSSRPSIFNSLADVTITYDAHRDSISIIFFGEMKYAGYQTIQFGLKGYGVTSLPEMVKFNGQKFILDGATNVASLDPMRGNDCQSTSSGQLYVRSMANNSNYLRMSGTFGFTYDDPLCGKTTVTYGRFDFKIVDFYTI